MNNNEDNFFDNLQPFDEDEAKKYMEAQQKAGESLSYLVHRIFAQTEDGRELLQRWREQMEMLAVVEPGIDMGEIGAREGYNRFIRAIIRSIKQVEKQS